MPNRNMRFTPVERTLRAPRSKSLLRDEFDDTARTTLNEIRLDDE